MEEYRRRVTALFALNGLSGDETVGLPREARSISGGRCNTQLMMASLRNGEAWRWGKEDRAAQSPNELDQNLITYVADDTSKKAYQK